MAKKPKLTTDEQVEQDTFESNLAAEEAADAAPLEMEPSATVPASDPVPESTPVFDHRGAAFTSDSDGHYVGATGYRELFIKLHGTRYEHVSETPDGRWVYAKS
jgi:hypothetical protein